MEQAFAKPIKDSVTAMETKYGDGASRKENRFWYRPNPTKVISAAPMPNASAPLLLPSKTDFE
jgi:hypothetical protein